MIPASYSNHFTYTKKIAVYIFFFFHLLPGNLYADLTFRETPLTEVIKIVQDKTPYFFLYRESQVADIRITLESTEERIIQDLRHELSAFNIELNVDHDRYQVLLIHKQPDSALQQHATIKGQVVDAETGERLPFATLTWTESNQHTGVASNSSGHFVIRRDINSSSFVISISYVGYKKRDIEIDLAGSNRIEDLTIRLEPEPMKGKEIIISGFSGYNPSDSLLTGMIDATRFSPLGESNSIRALQSHPSVSKGTALNNGINVRGSTPDGFLVLLDGLSIFNQSHLFGLLDSFNSDAIQTAGYYFGITPANIDTPTGGTLNLITRTGSRNEFKNRVGISNTSVNGTFEGPLGNKSSWLFSARTSYMNQIDWFSNPELIQWGLDINRPRRIASNDPDFTDLVLQPGASSARFIDMHGKLYLETENAGRFILSGYLGGDQTSHDATRRTRSAATEGQFTFEDVKTSNQWGNALMSIKYEQDFLNRFYSSTTAGFSTYETEFNKDDFVYNRVTSTEGNESVTIFTYPFRNRSSMNEFKIRQQIEYNHSLFTAVFGGTWKYYQGEYSESSFDRPSFYTQNNAHLADAYLQTEWDPFNALQISAGGRIYYYSPDGDILTSPRLQVRLSPFSKFHLFGGYSENHQFLHRVSLENAATADVWILSTRQQPAASSKQYSAGIEFIPIPSLYLRAEAYQKSYGNLRIHELNTQTLENTFSGTPWFFQNNGEAEGIEFILRNRWNHFTLTQSYTLSRMIFQNSFLLGGNEFYADWDRTHSYNAVMESQLSDNFRLYLSWIMMSGAPNRLFTYGSDNIKRLDPYYRLDASLVYQRQFSGTSQLEINISAFNLLNRDNVWYRNYAFNFDETRSIPRLRPIPVDVLDLGFQPSFSVTYSF